MTDLSVEEANKIRLSMGLAPLPVPGAAVSSSGLSFKPTKEANDSDEELASTIDTRQAAAYDNWKQLQDEQAAKKRRDERAAAIRKEREKASRYAQLEGTGLADEGGDEDDTAWLKGSKKRQKKIAKAEQMQRDLEERERQAREALQYTEADLAGVKVGHEVDQFDDGEDQVLVLKDTAVDDEDDDELEAVALKEKERLQERLDSKKRKRAYDPNDMDEGGQRSILAQYDEEIDGKQQKAFTLNGQGRTVEDIQAEVGGTGKPKKVTISLDILQEDTPTNDYMDISEVKMKKPKKKKSKSSKRKRIEDDEDMFAPTANGPSEDMDIDDTEMFASKPKKKSGYDESFVDDDDLQAHLTAQRQKALKKRKRMRPEDLARQLRDEASQTPDVVESTEAADEPALVIDETTEFVQNLGARPSEDEEEERRKRRKSSHVSNANGTPGNQQTMDEDGDMDMEQSYAEAADAEDRAHSESRARSIGVTETGLEAEKTVDQGLGATLALLKQRGLVQETDGSDQNAYYRERQKFLADKQRAEMEAERLRKAARERERTSARWNTMTPREREEWARKQNTAADQSESRRLAEIFNKEYKPNVELSYVDEHGRHMNQKEAFKQLSHQFHGKGSGNTKTKKHLDKVAAEKKKLAESSLDTTRAGGIGSAQDQQAKKYHTAGVRLQ